MKFEAFKPEEINYNISLSTSRSSLSSNSEGDDDLSRYSRATFDPILSQSQTNTTNMASSPYILRDTGQPVGESGGRKDEKYWERRR